MERVGVLIVSNCYSAPAIVDALSKSQSYETEFYVVEKQRNPFNFKRAKIHAVSEGLKIPEIVKFAKRHEHSIDFCLCDFEGPIINGLRDELEKETEIRALFPKREYAIEGSKVKQRLLFQEAEPRANPKFRVFKKGVFSSKEELAKELFTWLEEANVEPVVKPDRPAAGKGVGVWGQDFNTKEGLLEFLYQSLTNCDTIVEEKLYGEESSFQAFTDGKHIAVAPETRDYKRAFDGDRGKLTGGVGCYRAERDILPFMSKDDRERQLDFESRILEEWKSSERNEGLRGIIYDAFMHTAEGPKILERNSRGGNFEFPLVLATMKDDFVEVCFKMAEGSLKRIEFYDRASVITAAMPLTYAGYRESYSGSKEIDLSKAERLSQKYGESIRVYPVDVRLEGNKMLTGTSRSAFVQGIGETIREAREISLAGIRAIDGATWNRWDIASEEYIQRSIKQMEALRQSKS